ncbi:MAG: S8 family serine peptidase [Kineosporiaceae bacterium]
MLRSTSTAPARGRRRALARSGLLLAVASVPGLLLVTGTGAQATPAKDRHGVAVPDALERNGEQRIDGRLRAAKGTLDVSVALSVAPVAAVVAEDATRTGNLPSHAEQQSRTKAVTDQQADVTTRAKALGARITGRATRAGNVVTMRVAASRLDEIAGIPGVVSVKPVARYETTADPVAAAGSLAEAAEYLKVSGARAAGLDGRGVRVAVLDSGADYTHANLGGPGTEAAYEQCYAGADGKAADRAPVGDCAALFGPGAPKVKGGFDFVGETWPETAVEAPDPNPIDLEGHGTHVADIIGGRSADGSHTGLAPGVDVYAVKVCSAVASACSGVALIQGVDWALDPNGDGDISDAVDLMNLSLGSPYGQPEDDLTVAVNRAVRAGVVGVVSAGNSADKPFVVGSPSTASRAISVAQTTLPNDRIFPITVDSPQIPDLPGNTVRYSVLQGWSPAPTGAVTGALVRPGVPTGCEPADFATFPAGAVALIARGACAASVKASNASAAGASSVVIHNNLDGEPPSFGFGGGTVTVPTYTISLEAGTVLTAAIVRGAVSVTIDPADAVTLPNHMVGTSARGPRISDARVKPDLGAPGAWSSAEVGTGTGETEFGGTSGAAPTVSGVAALVLQKFPTATPATVKSRLLNGADPDNKSLDANGIAYPTPVTRIGAGEVRADTALGALGVLANTTQAAGNLSYGMPRATTTWSKTVDVALRNTSGTRKTYALSSSFRDAADAATGAVTVKVPASVSVPARSSRTVPVRLTVRPGLLRPWPFTFTAGLTGAGTDLNAPEFDGLVTATSGTETVHLGWQVLPRAAADVSAPTSATVRTAGTSVALRNRSAAAGSDVTVFGLTGTSRKQPLPAAGQPGSAGSNVALVDLAAVGVWDSPDDDLIQFAVADHRRARIPLYPRAYEVDVDTDRDGTADFAVITEELGGFDTSGQSVVTVIDLAKDTAATYFYNQADFDGATQALMAPLSALGLEQGDTFDFDVIAGDNYFSGLVTDSVDGMTWTVGAPKYRTASVTYVDPSSTTPLAVSRNPAAGESTQSGLLLLYGDNRAVDFGVVTLR